MERIVANWVFQDSVEFLGLRSDSGDLLSKPGDLCYPRAGKACPTPLKAWLAVSLLSTRVSGSEDIVTDGVTASLVEPEQTC